jgi:hypothetical protein
MRDVMRRRRRKNKRPSVAPADLGSLIDTLSDLDSQVRCRTVQALGHIGGQQATEALIGALADMEPEVRSWAAGMLGGVGNIPGSRQAVEPLMGALRDGNAEVRWSAAISLGLLRDQRAIEALMDLGDERALPMLRWVKEQDQEEIFLGRLSDLAEQAMSSIQQQRDA